MTLRKYFHCMVNLTFILTFLVLLSCSIARAQNIDELTGQWRGAVTTTNTLSPSEAINVINSADVINRTNLFQGTGSNPADILISQAISAEQEAINNIKSDNLSLAISKIDESINLLDELSLEENLTSPQRSQISSILVRDGKAKNVLSQDNPTAPKLKKAKQLLKDAIKKKKNLQAQLVSQNTNTMSGNTGNNPDLTDGASPLLSSQSMCNIGLDFCTLDNMLLGTISGAFNATASMAEVTSNGIRVEFFLHDTNGNPTSGIFKVIITPFEQDGKKHLSVLVENGLILETEKVNSICPFKNLPRFVNINPLGTPAPPVQDVSAFATCP